MTPQLFMIWNPFLLPKTITAHVEILREKVDGRPGFVWWGRIHSNPKERTSEEIKHRWAHIFSIFQNNPAPLLFVSDYHSLHALKIAEIRTGPDAPDDHFPDYYQGKFVSLWFRVVDVCGVKYDAANTVDYLTESFGRVQSREGSWERHDTVSMTKYEYPILIEGPETIALFKNPETQMASHDKYVYAPQYLQAQNELECKMGAELWHEFSVDTRHFLISSELAASVGGIDRGPAICGLAKALEVEFIDKLLMPLIERYPRQFHQQQADGHVELILQADDSSRKIRVELRNGRLTLGGASKILRFEFLRSLSIPEVNELLTWKPVLDEFIDVRNDGLHNKPVDQKLYEIQRRYFISEQQPSLLEAVVRARKACPFTGRSIE